jgi:integrase
MSSISILLRTVNENVNVFKMKLNYSEPKIFTGGVNISLWSKLNRLQQKEALKKEWFVYFSFRDSKTGKLIRQPHIKAGANKFKTKSNRLSFLKTIQRNLLLLLEAGFNPYKDNSTLEKEFFGKEKIEVPKKEIIDIEQSNNLDTVTTVTQALKFGLELKEKMMNQNSYVGFQSKIRRFKKWLIKKELENESISIISKKLVNEYLNLVLKTSSARNRNNTRTDIRSLFQVLEDNDIVKDNFVRKINIIKTIPIRNKTYSPKLQKDIYDYLEKTDPLLLLFVKFVSYNFLRPVEVCRLRIEDVDIEDKKIYVRAKNKPVKIKIIPDILVEALPDISRIDKKHFLFTAENIGGEWDATETNKRDYFTKRFKKVKNHFGFGKEYGLYSFRHTFITKLYRQLRKNASPFEAKSKLMVITGHSSMTALEKYLRDIDAELPKDYSYLLK